MPFRPCVSGCSRYLAPGDGHDRCLSCLGIEHTEEALVSFGAPPDDRMSIATSEGESDQSGDDG